MVLDYDTLRVIWWLFLGALLIGFAVTDGFDLGVGILLPIMAKTDEERRVLINAIGPTWEGNQVWFITGGGALFAAWPLAYAVAFSGLYFALLLVLFALFFRPIGFDYRSKLSSPKWRAGWDWGLFAGGFVPALLFGVAFGNLLQGIPFYFDEDMRTHYTGTLMGLLNPFALLAGLISLSMLVMQGAAFLQMKTEGALYERSKKAVFWGGLAALAGFAVGGLWMTKVSGYHITSEILSNAVSDPLGKTVTRKAGLWLDNYEHFSMLWMLPVVTFIAGALTLFFSRKDCPAGAFVSSSMVQAGIILTTGFSMFPFLIPSSIATASSLTVWDASSSHSTLKIMFWVTIFFLPIVVSYTGWVYRVLRGKVTIEHIRKNDHTSY